MLINPSAQQDYLEGVQRDEVVWVGHAKLNLRYLLYVPLQPQPTRTLLVIGKNPSAALAEKSDQTVNQIIRYVKESGRLKWVEQIIVANLYASYGTNSQHLVTAQASSSTVVGPRNDEFIARAACEAEQIIVAWGGEPTGANVNWTRTHYNPRVRTVLTRLPEEKLRCVSHKSKKPREGDLYPFHPRNWSARLDSVYSYKKPRQ